MGLTVLIVDDEENARQNLGELLATKSYDVIGVGTLGEAREHLRKGDADIVYWISSCRTDMVQTCYMKPPACPDAPPSL